MPAGVPMQNQQQGGLGGMLQGNAGKYAMGALAGGLIAIEGERLLHGIEGGGEYERHRRYDDEGGGGLLGGLNDIGIL